MPSLLEVIYEDAELLVVAKPAGLVCHPTKAGEYSSLIGRVRMYLAAQSASPEPARCETRLAVACASHPHLVNRLDRETSGVTVVARNDDTARELRRLWERREVEKEYLALVHGHVREQHGIIEAPLGKDERSRVAIKDCVRADGAPSITEFWVVRRSGSLVAAGVSPAVEGGILPPGPASELLSTLPFLPSTLLRIRPHTGRKHQIRIHLAHIGHPVVGDKLYGEDEDLYLALVENRLTEEQRRRLVLPNHALHAYEVRFEWRGKRMAFRADPPDWANPQTS
jgi:23S rRNA pseudouridine1911/1915/1917 synthase